MLKSLYNFPEAFSPLVVVIGDRRESKPKTKGDLLVYSVSSVDVTYIHYLNLPKSTLILSDKIFVLEDKSYIEEKFGTTNILTIGSPAVNLFSRQINKISFFKLFISDDAIQAMRKQEEILDTIKTDKLGLLIYHQILNGVKAPDIIAKTFKIPDIRIVKEKFDKIFSEYEKTGLKNYKDLMHKFEGEYIIDPVEDKKLDLENQVKRGTFIQDYNDFGFVSLSKNPFASSDDYCCVYVAGRHGPATSHGLRLLSIKDFWKNRPLGGSFEIQMDQVKAFSEKFENAIEIFETDEYFFDDKKIKRQYENILKKMPKISYFLSTPYKPNDNQHINRIHNLNRSFESHFKDKGYLVEFLNPYNIPKIGEWSFVKRVYDLFPDRDFIIHDITAFPLGVISEIGGSFGLNKKLFFFWDKKEPFKANLLPKLISKTDVMEVDFLNLNEINSVLQKHYFSPLEIKKSQNLCPAQDSRDHIKCEFHSSKKIKKNEKWIFIYNNKSLEKLRSIVIDKIFKFQLIPKFYEDFSGDRIICKICKAISSCQYSVIDFSDNDLDGIIILGMIRIREYKAIPISKIGTTKEISMWDKTSMNWHDETLNDDIYHVIDTLKNL